MSRILLSVATAVALLAPAAARAEVKEGDHFVELDAKAANGKQFRLKDMAGKWVLYTFGASWCQPCHKELVAWDKLAPKFSGKVIFVTVNINKKPEEGKAFLDSLKVKHLFPVFMPDDDSAAMQQYDPAHMPSTFVIDPKGIVRHVHYGYDKGDETKLEKALTDLVK